MYCRSSPGSHLPARHQAIPRYRMREQCWDDISKTFTLLYTLPVISQSMIPTQLLWVNRPLPQNWIQFNINILLEKKCRHQQVIFCPKGLDFFASRHLQYYIHSYDYLHRPSLIFSPCGIVMSSRFNGAFRAGGLKSVCSSDWQDPVDML